jgi:hypothetical protein
VGAIGHLDFARSRKASTPAVIVHGHGMDSLCFTVLELGWFWWRHIIEDFISSLNKVIEQIASEVGHSWIFKVIFYLQLQGPDERTQVVPSPFSEILLVVQSNIYLVLKVFQ